MMQRLPNLFLIGAMKGGSTSLYDSLVRHPEIGRLRRKEPSIFSQAGDDAVRARLAEFPAIDAGTRYLIDGSVEYSRHPLYPTTPETIRRFCGDDVRVVYILRHPVDRLVSEYFWMQERYGQPLDIARVVEADPQYVATSRYDLQIERYLEVFDRDRMHFVLFDDFVRERQETVAAIYRWLDLDPDRAEPEVRLRGATDKSKTRSPRFGALNALLWSQPALRRAVRRRLPERTVRRLAWLMTVEADRVDPTAAFREDLMRRHFRASIARTAELTGLDLTAWTAPIEGGAKSRTEAA
jgi:hypothetical protein